MKHKPFPGHTHFGHAVEQGMNSSRKEIHTKSYVHVKKKTKVKNLVLVN